MNNKKHELIEKYWAGDLIGEELKAFKKQMQENPEFAEEVNLYKEIEKSIAHRIRHKKEESELRTTLNKLQKGQNTTAKKSKVIPLMGYRKWLVAASIAAIVGIFIWQDKTPTYADFDINETMEVSVRGETNRILEEVQDDFNTGNFEEFNRQFCKIDDYYSDNPEVQLFYGISLMKTDQYNMAYKVFSKIADGDSLFKHKAHWYLALNALKQNDLETCKLYLEKIPKEADMYKEATKLLDKL